MLTTSQYAHSKEWEFLMPQKIRRCAIYRRISDEDSQGKGTSLSDQLDATKAHIVKDGGVVKEEHIFTDTLSGAGKRLCEKASGLGLS